MQGNSTDNQTDDKNTKVIVLPSFYTLYEDANSKSCSPAVSNDTIHDIELEFLAKKKSYFKLKSEIDNKLKIFKQIKTDLVELSRKAKNANQEEDFPFEVNVDKNLKIKKGVVNLAVGGDAVELPDNIKMLLKSSSEDDFEKETDAVLDRKIMVQELKATVSNLKCKLKKTRNRSRAIQRQLEGKLARETFKKNEAIQRSSYLEEQLKNYMKTETSEEQKESENFESTHK